MPAGLSADGAGVVPGRHPAELRVRSLLVVVEPPVLQHGAGVRQRSEEGLVQQLVAQPAVEALVVAVLLGLAGRDVVPADAGVVGPAQDGVGGVFRAVVADDGVRASALADDAEAAQKAGMTPQEAKEAFGNAEKGARESATLKGQVARMRNQLAKVGKGGEDPPCWVTESGDIQYLLDIDLLGSDRLRVRDATPVARLADRKALDLPGTLFGRELSRAEFLRLTLPIERFSKARDCRFFVYANDRTGPAQKLTFQNLLLTVEGRFYKNLRRSRG